MKSSFQANVELRPVTPPRLFIGGRWMEGEAAVELALVDPATGKTIADFTGISPRQIQAAIDAAARAFPAWAATPSVERAGILRAAAARMRDRVDEIARVLTLEQGKPISESRGEVLSACEIFEWNADEGRRLYGRIVPPHVANTAQHVWQEPVGPVAAFTPWNFPALTPARKISGALAAGCTCVIKPAEETPLTCLAIAAALAEAGLPPGVLNVVFGDAGVISNALLESPAIRKISFTGSTRVGRMLAERAGRALKKATLELGGHAPVIVFDDADLDLAVSQVASLKYRNAGQICISPTRFLVQEGVFGPFLERFQAYAGGLRVGPGLEERTQMGPLANKRRATAIGELVEDAIAAGAGFAAPLCPPPVGGWYSPPTVLSRVPLQARIMNEEPFGPVAVVNSFKECGEATVEANRLPFGLSAFVFTRSLATAQIAASAIESGMVAVNTAKVAWPELPFGGVKDSGSGSEGGIEGLRGYTVTKSVSLAW